MTDLNVDHITAPEVTPDQWAAARAWLEAEHPDLGRHVDRRQRVNGCKVTLTTGAIRNGRGYKAPRCALPVVAHGLCERHLADRVRLGGAA